MPTRATAWPEAGIDGGLSGDQRLQDPGRPLGPGGRRHLAGHLARPDADPAPGPRRGRATASAHRGQRLLTWTPYLVGVPVFLVALYVFFENFGRLLPGNY